MNERISKARKAKRRREVLSYLIQLVIVVVIIIIVIKSNPMEQRPEQRSCAQEVSTEQIIPLVIPVINKEVQQATRSTQELIQEIDSMYPEIGYLSYTEQEVYLLAKLIHCEAGIDNYTGKLAVGTVVMNRTVHSNKRLYGGSSIEGVILHKLDGAKSHQFSCVDVKHLWAEEPGEDSIRAAKEVLNGFRSFDESYLYYWNPTLCNGIKGIKEDKNITVSNHHVFGKEAN